MVNWLDQYAYLHASGLQVKVGSQEVMTLVADVVEGRLDVRQVAEALKSSRGVVARGLRYLACIGGPTGPWRALTCPRKGAEQGSGGCELEEFRNALGVGVGLEAGEELVDEADAAGRAEPAGEEEGFCGGGRGGFGLLKVEVARGAVGEEDAAGLVAGCRQHLFALVDELVGAGGVAEVE